MSRPQTLEQTLLSEANDVVARYSPEYEHRMQILEACAAAHGGFDIDGYWAAFGVAVEDPEGIRRAARQLADVLAASKVPFALAVSGLAREPISLSEKKKNGVFYTDFRLAEFVAEDCAPHLRRDSRVADIAAGSGVLLAAIAERYRALYPDAYDRWISECVFAFDLSANALRGARAALAANAGSVGAVLRMCANWGVCDSLTDGALDAARFDIVAGNPPWGKVRLSLHAFVNGGGANHVYGSRYGAFDRERFSSDRRSVLDYGRSLRARYSLLGDAEPDLYMAFLQRAADLLADGGHLSYIVPAGLIRSQGTEPLRRFLLARSRELRYCLLDNKAGFFEIDSRFKFLIVSSDRAGSDGAAAREFELSICAADGAGVRRGERVAFDAGALQAIRPDLTVPECRSEREKALFFKLCRNGRAWRTAWGADVSREIDMTNNRADFHARTAATDVPVIEGRMVQQFRFGAKAWVSGSGRGARWTPCAGEVRPQFYMSADVFAGPLADRIRTPRAGYCDIAGQTNERAMTSAVVPPGVVCGNKVPTVVFRGEGGEDRLYFWVGVTNSFAFDWLLRRVLSTTVNYFLLFSLPMPDIGAGDPLARRITALSRELSELGAEYYTDARMGELRAELDLCVAQAYGLSFADMELILRDFPLLDRAQPPLPGEERSTYTRDLLLAMAATAFGADGGFYEKRRDEGRARGARAYIPAEMAILCAEGGTDGTDDA